ncbi:MAG: hypothetical protein ACKOWL_05565 [Sphingobacteriaceae bacterium]
MLNKIKRTTILMVMFLAGLLIQSKASLGQKNIKPDLYLLFKENIAKGMFKESRKDEALIRPEKKKYIPEYKYVIYGYQLGADREGDRYKFATMNINNYCIRDSNFVKKNVKEFDAIKNIKGFFYDTSYKEFPYKRVFIVDYINANQYKVIEVSTYLGSDY